MKKISAKLFASVSLIITVAMGGIPLAGRAAPEVVAWGYDESGATDVPSGLSHVVAIAAGQYHSLALTDEGRLVAWGANGSGQTSVPSGLSHVVAIAAGEYHSLALTDEGRVVAWGANGSGQTSVPSGLSHVVAIAAGGAHSLALTDEGHVVAWGENGDGQTAGPSGFLNAVAIAAGDAYSLALTAEGRLVAWGKYYDYGYPQSAYVPVTVPSGLSNVVAIAAGYGLSLALTAEGKVVAWGADLSGQTNVPGGLSDVVAIAAGQGQSLALTAEGKVVAWGANWAGQATVPSGLTNVVMIAAGSLHSLALRGLSPGVAAPAWVGPRFLMGTVDRPFQHRIMIKNGADAYGTAGLPPGLALDPGTGLITGQPAQAGRYDVVLSATNRVGSCAWTVTLFVNLPLPAIASGGLVLAGLGSVFNYTVVAYNTPEWYGASGLPAGWVMDSRTGVISGVPVAFGDNAVSLMASNRYGLSTGSLTISVSPVVAWGWNYYGQTNVPSGLSNVVALATGGCLVSGQSLALTAEGRVVAWGKYYDGSGYYVPMTVPSGLSNGVAIAVGSFHSLALTAEGYVLAWGRSWYGQTNVPSGLSNVVALAAGYGLSLALTAEGKVVAWGANWAGQATVPSGLSNVVAIAAGYYHSLALTAEGRVVAWGAGRPGTSGDPHYGQATVPSGLSNVVAIAAGGNHSLALTAAGRVVAWGYNASGQTSVPGGLSNVVAIAAGSYHSLALTAEGRLVAWGWTEPSGLSNVVAIAAGYGDSLALIGLPPGAAAPAWVGPQFLVATVDRPFHHRIMARNGVTAYGAAGLPPGLALDPGTGLITGQAAQPGTYSLALSATNRAGSCAWTVTLFVNGPPRISSSGLVQAGLGSGFSYPVAAYNAPVWYGATGLPAGLVIDAHTGVISGVPLEAGDFAVSLVVTNGYGPGTGSLILRVSPVVAWGANEYGQATVPAGLSNVVAIEAGGLQSLALTAEGGVVAWGKYHNGSAYVPMTVPSGLSNVVAIAAGWYHSLALTAEGRVVAWGNNEAGQTTVPNGLSSVVAIAAGGSHSLALTAEGRVVAWGANESGQATVPAGLSNVVAIAAGGAWYIGGHSLALTAEGRVVAWGYNQYGQATVPSGLSNVVAIAAGGYRSLALTAEGQVVAWGVHMTASMNPWGLLDYSPIPVTVPSGLSNVMAIAAGDSNNLALTAKGWVVAWGSNGASQMPSGLTNEVAIAAGGDHFLALSSLPPGVAAPAWAGPRFLAATVGHPFQHRIMVKNGADTFGSTGLPPGLALDPSTGLITGQPAQAGKYAVVLSATNRVGSCEWTVTLFVNGPAVPGIASSGLVQASLGIGFNYPVVASYEPVWYGARGLPPGLVMDAQTGVISGVPVETGDFVVSLLASNRYGLGTGSLTVRVSPVVGWGGWGHSYDNSETNMPAGLNEVVAIAAGGSDSLALTAQGRVVSWGWSLPNGLSNVVAIASGYYHGLALTAQGRVVAWGWSDEGQTAVPSGLSNVVAIAAGGVWPDGGHSLALTAEGRVVAWGRSDEGQTAVPSGLLNVVAVAAGGYHSLALTSEGRVVGWGSYTAGPDFIHVTVPGELSNVVAIAAAADSSLALTAEGRVVAWGNNWEGPPPEGLSNVVAIAAGEYHCMALTAAGRVVDWGVFYNGQNYVSKTVVSPSSNVVAIAAGGNHSLALLRQPTVPTPRLELSRGLSGLELQAHGMPGISCLLLRASRLPGPWLPAEPVTFTNSVQLLRPPDASEPAQFFRLLRK